MLREPLDDRNIADYSAIGESTMHDFAGNGRRILVWYRVRRQTCALQHRSKHLWRHYWRVCNTVYHLIISVQRPVLDAPIVEQLKPCVHDWAQYRSMSILGVSSKCASKRRSLLSDAYFIASHSIALYRSAGACSRFSFQSLPPNPQSSTGF